eukprot:gene3009-biopygen599
MAHSQRNHIRDSRRLAVIRYSKIIFAKKTAGPSDSPAPRRDARWNTAVHRSNGIMPPLSAGGWPERKKTVASCMVHPLRRASDKAPKSRAQSQACAHAHRHAHMHTGMRTCTQACAHARRGAAACPRSHTAPPPLAEGTTAADAYHAAGLEAKRTGTIWCGSRHGTQSDAAREKKTNTPPHHPHHTPRSLVRCSLPHRQRCGLALCGATFATVGTGPCGALRGVAAEGLFPAGGAPTRTAKGGIRGCGTAASSTLRGQGGPAGARVALRHDDVRRADGADRVLRAALLVGEARVPSGAPGQAATQQPLRAGAPRCAAAAVLGPTARDDGRNDAARVRSAWDSIA